jgi:hypothetical protein
MAQKNCPARAARPEIASTQVPSGSPHQRSMQAIAGQLRLCHLIGLQTRLRDDGLQQTSGDKLHFGPAAFDIDEGRKFDLLRGELHWSMMRIVDVEEIIKPVRQ